MTIVNFFDLHRGQTFKVKNSAHTFCWVDAAYNSEDKLGTVIVDCDAGTFFTICEFILDFVFYEINENESFGVEI